MELIPDEFGGYVYGGWRRDESGFTTQAELGDTVAEQIGFDTEQAVMKLLGYRVQDNSKRESQLYQNMD